jgi:hemolysin III
MDLHNDEIDGCEGIRMNSTEIESFLGMRHPVSAASHLVWALVSVFVAVDLVRRCRGDRAKQRAVGVFGVSIVLLYGISGLFHAIPANQPGLVQTFRLLDHSAICVLIAGTYTPVFAVLLAGRLRTLMLSLVLGLAGLGIACKWLLPLPPHGLTVVLYAATGAMGFLPMRSLLEAVGARGLLWMMSGAVCYVIGGVFDALRWPVLVAGWVGSHEVLHMLDICGTSIHVGFVAVYVVPFRRAPSFARLVKARYSQA